VTSLGTRSAKPTFRSPNCFPRSCKLTIHGFPASREDRSDQELAAVFKGPVDKDYFDALRDIFPTARALSDADLMAAACQANSAICALSAPVVSFPWISIITTY
jgi:hypothetical protein